MTGAPRKPDRLGLLLAAAILVGGAGLLYVQAAFPAKCSREFTRYEVGPKGLTLLGAPDEKSRARGFTDLAPGTILYRTGATHARHPGWAWLLAEGDVVGWATEATLAARTRVLPVNASPSTSR
jgi:hypothetical protein